ncbi:MAG: signal recognition particle receptor subunit alpha, partial [Dehalococcoidales bacterium]
MKRSRDNWFARAMHLFDRSVVSDEVWSELEELLVMADVGINTTEKLIQRVRRRVVGEKIERGDQVRDVLKAEMVALLQVARLETA